MTNRTVIMFARAPRFGTVKTRLARDIGGIETLRFYRNTLACVSRKLSRDSRISFKIALTPDTLAHICAGPLFSDLAIIPQGRGDLGKRMTRSFSNSHGPTLIIGSDIPDIDPIVINDAFAALGNADVVFSPAEDGGYSLVGVKHPTRLPREFMTNVRWSSAHTLKDTIATLPKHWTINYIDPLDDIDDGNAYYQWKTKSGHRKLG